MQSVLVNIPKGAQLIILHPGTQPNMQPTCQSSMHVMAAVALSELASGVDNKKDSSTQTDTISTVSCVNCTETALKLHHRQIYIQNLILVKIIIALKMLDFPQNCS